MLNPAFALVSMNMTLNSRALASPSSIDTCLPDTRISTELDTSLCSLHLADTAGLHLLSTRSVLLPTRTTMTSLPRSVRTSSIHRAVLRKVCRPATACQARLQAEAGRKLPGSVLT